MRQKFVHIFYNNHYYPFGLTMAGISNKAAGSLANRYKYNGIEQNNDFDLNTYDAHYRNNDPQLGRWWQIDPKAEKYYSFTPYMAMGNVPVRITDPLGDWIPSQDRDGNITFKKEKGDDLKTFQKFLGEGKGIFSMAQISKMFKGIKGETVILSKGNFVNAIKASIAAHKPTEEQNLEARQMLNEGKSENEVVKKFPGVNWKDDYNCYGTCYNGVKGQELKTMIDDPRVFDRILDEQGIPISEGEAIFGKSIIRYAPNNGGQVGDVEHGAIFFGKDNSGNTYVFTKNGRSVQPGVQTKAELEKNHPSYGTPTSLSGNGNSGYYNLK